MSSQVRAALAVFDSAALEALANKGLLRRAAKDVEAGKVAIAAEDTELITVIADGERVGITAAGPRAASCSCPASGVCRHKLAAVLLLQATTPAQPSTAEAGAADFGTPPPDALAEVLALAPQTIQRWAGKAAMQAALEMIAQAEPAIDSDGGSLRVRLGAAWPPVLILAGQGLDGIVSKAAPSRQKPLHAAAVIAVRRAHGLDADACTEALEPSSDAHLPDTDFIDDVVSALEDAVLTAFVHAPEVLEERFFVLSVSSRADDLPLLSRRLRQIAGMIRARRERDFTALPEELLSALATAFALAHAIKASPDPVLTARLRGTVRQGFAPVGSLSLIGLGARTWQTRSGAHGVTGYFCTSEGGRVVTASLARAGGYDTSFDAVTAYSGELLWGSGSLADMVGAQVSLQGARLSASARLSMSQETSGLRRMWRASRAEIATWSIAYDDWTTLAEHLRQRFALSLTRADAGPAVLALLPSAAGVARFDVVGQRSCLALADAQGRSVVIVSPRPARRKDRAGVDDPLLLLGACAAIEAIIVEAVSGSGAIELRPIAAFVRRQADDPPIAMNLDPLLVRDAKDHAGSTSLTPGIAATNDDGAMMPAIPHDPLTALAAEITDALLALAELGLMRARDDIHRQFAALARRGRDMGLATLAAACVRVANAEPIRLPASILKLFHLADRVASLNRRLQVAPPPFSA